MVRMVLLIFLLVIQTHSAWAEPIPFVYTITGDLQAREILWISAFKEVMHKHPAQFKRYLYRRAYGQSAEIEEKIRSFATTGDRYIAALDIPVLGPMNARMKLIKELAKDADAKFGPEAAKVQLQEASNRCINCMEMLAQEAYEHHVKQASGVRLTSEEKAANDVVDSLIGSGLLPSMKSSSKDILRFANPNEVTVFQGDATTIQVLNALANYDAKSTERLEDYLRKNNIKEDQIKKVAVDLKWVRESMEAQAAEAADMRTRLNNRAKKEQYFVAANAYVNLVGSILRLTDPVEAQRFTNVSLTTISMGKAWLDYQDSAKTAMAKGILTASTLTAAIFIVEQMQSQSRTSENQYVMQALEQIRDMLVSVQSQLGRIDDRLVRLEIGIDKLSRDASAQYASLKEHIDVVSNQLTEATLREWQKDRANIEDGLNNEVRKCHQLFDGNQLDHEQWFYSKQPASEQKNYRECLSAVLAYGDAYARTFAIMNLPQKTLADLPDLELFHKSFEANLPSDLWIPQIAKPVARVDKTPVKDQPTPQLTPKSNICDELLDVVIWDKAVRAYVELRARVPDFTVNPNTHKSLWEQEQKVRALGEKANKCMSNQLSPDRFAAIVAQYRQGATNLLIQLRALTVSFLTEEYQRLWCNQPVVNSFDGLGTPKSWVIRSCFVSGPSYNASPDGQLTFSPETIWYPGSTRIPWLGRLTIIPPDLLLLHQDVMALGASLAKHEIPASLTLRMPQDNQTTADLDTLLYGLRGVLALRTVLGQIEDPMSLKSPIRNRINVPVFGWAWNYFVPVSYKVEEPTITVPSIQPKHAVKMCLVGLPTHDPEGMTKCGSEAVSGCFSVEESTRMSSFTYKRVCDGREHVPYNPDHFSDDNINNLHDQMEKWSSESVSRHTTAAMAFRNHGAPRTLTNAECGHPEGLCTGNYTYSLTIQGLSSNGHFSKDGLFKQAYPLHSVPANIDETFALDKIQPTLEQISRGFQGLVDNWFGYLDRNDHLLIPYYQDLNRAYIQLKIHSALHLQLSAVPSDGVKAFFQAPLSGSDVQKSIKNHQLPRDFSSRLLLTKEDWRVPFPTVSRMQLISEANIHKTPCLTMGSSTKYLSFKKRSKAESREVRGDLYCQMWEEITAFEIKRANKQKTIGVSPNGTSIFPFAVGSGYLTEGLALLADQRDMDMIVQAFVSAQGKSRRKSKNQSLGSVTH